MAPVVIVGASLAGTQAAQAMRRAGYGGDMVMVGSETHFPYDRPPLSKNYLTDEQVDESRLRLRPAADPAALGVEWLLGRRAESLAVDRSELVLDGGEVLIYDGLIIATGAAPRRLPGAEHQPSGVMELRTLDDARALRQLLRAGPGGTPRRLVVCGAGFIGAEVAASARSCGLEVTLVDVAATPLDRVLDHEAGMAVADLHRSHGVDVRLETGVVGFEHDGHGPARDASRSPSVSAVNLSDGTTVPADIVVVGIGVIPNTAWLDSSGLTIDDGVVVDETCMAAPAIAAAGDVARWPNTAFGGRLMRIEQWDNAVDMGMYVGKRMLAALDQGHETATPVEPFAPVPWFWSDQYDRKIQLAGLVDANREVVNGTIAEQRFVQIYSDGDGRLTGALCWNRPRQAIQARQLVAAEETAETARRQLGETGG